MGDARKNQSREAPQAHAANVEDVEEAVENETDQGVVEQDLEVDVRVAYESFVADKSKN